MLEYSMVIELGVRIGHMAAREYQSCICPLNLKHFPTAAWEGGDRFSVRVI